MQHRSGSSLRWKRCYQYAQDSNRLLATGRAGERQIPENPNDSNDPNDTCPVQYVSVPTLSQRYEYDAHGNMITMPHLPLMQWDFKDQLQATSRQVVNDDTPEITYYVYNANGQRVRKVTERQSAGGQTPTRRSERLYLGGSEIYREYNGNGNTVMLERETLHVMDDQQRIAQIDTRTRGNDDALPQSQRHLLSNHLGSAVLEVDKQANIISYEEYHPYGTSAYQAGHRVTEVHLKRYRYTGMERDEETGLGHHGARYCAYWLGRWTAADPMGLADGINRYAFVSGNPVRFNDSSGLAKTPPSVSKALSNDFPDAPTGFFDDLEAGEVREHRSPGAGGRNLVHIARNTGSMTTGASFRLMPTDVDHIQYTMGVDKGQAEFLSFVWKSINRRKINLVRMGLSPSLAEKVISKSDWAAVFALTEAMLSLLQGASVVHGTSSLRSSGGQASAKQERASLSPKNLKNLRQSNPKKLGHHVGSGTLDSVPQYNLEVSSRVKPQSTSPVHPCMACGTRVAEGLVNEHRINQGLEPLSTSQVAERIGANKQGADFGSMRDYLQEAGLQPSKQVKGKFLTKDGIGKMLDRGDDVVLSVEGKDGPHAVLAEGIFSNNGQLMTRLHDPGKDFNGQAGAFYVAIEDIVDIVHRAFGVR